MRRITEIIIHCSATKAGQWFEAKDIDSWHRQRGFNMIGYHYVILLDGTIQEGRPLQQVGAHCVGHNAHSIGICYIGGLDAKGQPSDTRTQAQKDALAKLIWRLSLRLVNSGQGFPEVYGHRDLSPDKNGDGVISPDEWLKECPCFNAREEYN